MLAPALAQPIAGRRSVPGRTRTWDYAPALIIAVAAVLLQSLTALDNDVSWLLTVAEHVLDGQRLYVDIVETNPPASVLLYVPAVAVARMLGVAPEPVTALILFALAALTIWSSMRLLIAAGIVPERRRPVLLALAAFLFLLLPGALFAQREHIALLTLLPMMAVTTLRAERRPVSLAAAIAAGLGAGVTIAIKPHFALALLPMTLLAGVRSRSWRAMASPEIAAAGTIVLAYGAIVLLCFPAFVRDTLPILRDVYLPARAPWYAVCLPAAMLLQVAAVLVTLSVARTRILASRAALPLLASLGFAAAAVIQGKGYLNHYYPGVALALLALAIVVAEKEGDAHARRFAAGAGALLAAVGFWFFAHVYHYAGLTELVTRAAPPHPRMMLAGGDLGAGHPLVRAVGGEWVGHSHSLWVTGNAVYLLGWPPRGQTAAERAHLTSLADGEMERFADDVVQRRPDVVLVDGTSAARWIGQHPHVRAALAAFRPAGQAAGVLVLVRKVPRRA